MWNSKPLPTGQNMVAGGISSTSDDYDFIKDRSGEIEPFKQGCEWSKLQ
jgi:hypothetical protein